MDFIIQHHTIRSFDFLNFIFAEIEFTALGKSVLARSNGIHNLALCKAHCSVRSNNILGCTDFINCARKSGDFINRLINNLCILRAAYAYSVEYFAGFLNGNCAFLSHIRLIHLNQCDTAFLCGIFLSHIKRYRSAVEYIPIGSLNLNKRITFAIFKFFGSYKLSVCVGVESVNGCRCRISKCHTYFVAGTCIRNCLACFSVFLYHLDITLKVGIVDEITVGLSVLRNEHIKVFHKLTTFPTFGLMNGIYAVRHILCLSKTVFITNDGISLIFFCCFKTSERFKIDFKSCTVFGCFNLCFSVIGVFDDSNISFHNLFGNIVRNKAVFNRKELRFCTDFVNCIVKKIALGRCDFSDCPVAVADIFLCGELSVAVGYILIHKCFAFVDTVNSTGKFSVALSSTFFTVALCYCNAELFKNVGKISICNLIPLNRCRLLFGNNIADCSIHFFNGIWCTSADKHIFECCNTVFVGNCVFINGDTCKRSAVKVESYTLYKIIF